MANEQRLIDANALMDEFRRYMVERYDREKCVSAENCKTCETGCLWRKKVCAAPTVDAVEVVHGRWLPPKKIAFTEVCSVCDGHVFWDEDGSCHRYKYCPHCGAKMDGGDEGGK